MKTSAPPELTPILPLVNFELTYKITDADPYHKITSRPEQHQIDHRDTVIAFKLIGAPDRVELKGMKVTATEKTEISSPTISLSGKVLACIDANISPITYKIDILYTDHLGKERELDPQLINKPETHTVPPA